jgi:hypothetical protein
MVATDDPVALKISIDGVNYRNEANLETNKYPTNTTLVHSKTNCSYMFRLVLSHPQAVSDYVKRKCKRMCVMLFKTETSIWRSSYIHKL